MSAIYRYLQVFYGCGIMGMGMGLWYQYHLVFIHVFILPINLASKREKNNERVSFHMILMAMVIGDGFENPWT